MDRNLPQIFLDHLCSEIHPRERRPTHPTGQGQLAQKSTLNKYTEPRDKDKRAPAVNNEDPNTGQIIKDDRMDAVKGGSGGKVRQADVLVTFREGYITGVILDHIIKNMLNMQEYK